MSYLSRVFTSLNFVLLTALITFSQSNFAAQPKSCDTPEYRQFDFWIGDWDVFDANNKRVGENKIFAILKGCALSENWQSVSGNPGVSYNFYDKAEKTWHQTWVDQSGGALYLKGSLQGKSMVLEGNRPGKEGEAQKHKISWTPLKDGRVKQHWQVSSNKAPQWRDLFVGFYQKKKP